MKILEQAFNKINPIHKKQKDFFLILIYGMIGIVGKRTFRNLARFMQITEHTFARQMSKTFDFTRLNTALVKDSLEESVPRIASQDGTFIPKSGKSTNGLGYFWNGSAGKAEKGLELDTIAVIAINGEDKEGYTISAEQIPPSPAKKNRKVEDLTKIDFAVTHLKKVAEHLLQLGALYIAVDAFYTKIKYVDGAIEAGLHVVGKLRIDARLARSYTGPQKARGRKRKKEIGKIQSKDFDNAPTVQLKDGIELRGITAYSVSLKRVIKVVRVTKCEGGKIGICFLFSTDINIKTEDVYRFYGARFHIEFIFRDAKGFTGLADAQTRNKERLHYHFNASLTALNVAKLQHHSACNKDVPFSMASIGRKKFVEIVINQFIVMFGFDPTLIKLHPQYENLLEFGTVRY